MAGAISAVRRVLRERLLRTTFAAGKFRLKRFGRVDPGSALVVICLWNRSTRFRELLDDLAAQDVPNGITLGLWNNDRRQRSYYERELVTWLETHPQSALSCIMLTHSQVNAGGFGRFYLGNRLARELGKQHLIFLDDDQRIQPDFVRRVLHQAAPKTVASWWAWQIENNDYWDRTRALPGEPADYTGTGGMVLDSALLAVPNLVAGLEPEHWFLEDIWLSHLAKVYGFELKALDADISFVMEETNQHHQLGTLKPDYYRTLAKLRRSE